ncbi:MAG: toll/interleukin-1 receptor domain-containing protein [Acidobacteriota bacterium]
MLTPDPELERHLRSVIRLAKEETRAEMRTEQAAAAERFVLRGVGNTGPSIVPHEQIALDAFRKGFEKGWMSVLQELTNIYDTVPHEAGGWILEQFMCWAEEFALSFTDSVTIRERAGVTTEDLGDAIGETVALCLARLTTRLESIQIRGRLRGIASRHTSTCSQVHSSEFDVFISHASEDKAAVAEPLMNALVARGLQVWLDKAEIRLGHSIYDSIETGLRRSRFGVVILSPNFFAKRWPRRELTALAALEDAEDIRKILPIWHNVDRAYVAENNALLAGVAAAQMADGIEAVADQIAAEVRSLATEAPTPTDPVAEAVTTAFWNPEQLEALTLDLDIVHSFAEAMEERFGIRVRSFQRDDRYLLQWYPIFGHPSRTAVTDLENEVRGRFLISGDDRSKTT